MTGPRRLTAAVTIAQLEEHIEDIDVTPDGVLAALASAAAAATWSAAAAATAADDAPPSPP